MLRLIWLLLISHEGSSITKRIESGVVFGRVEDFDDVDLSY